MTGLLDRLRASTEADATRRQFGLWALTAMILILPIWWMWGADLFAALLKPFAQLVFRLTGLTGEVWTSQHGWRVGTRLTSQGAPYAMDISRETLRRLSLGVPLAAAFLISPPRTVLPLRTIAIVLGVLGLAFLVSLVFVVWGNITPLLDPSRASATMAAGARLDQPPINAVIAQVLLVGRYVCLSILPLIVAILLWTSLNPIGRDALLGNDLHRARRTDQP